MQKFVYTAQIVKQAPNQIRAITLWWDLNEPLPLHRLILIVIKNKIIWFKRVTWTWVDNILHHLTQTFQLWCQKIEEVHPRVLTYPLETLQWQISKKNHVGGHLLETQIQPKIKTKVLKWYHINSTMLSFNTCCSTFDSN